MGLIVKIHTNPKIIQEEYREHATCAKMNSVSYQKIISYAVPSGNNGMVPQIWSSAIKTFLLLRHTV